MPLDKIRPDDMNEVACVMLEFIDEEDKQAGTKMSYGDFGKLLAKNYGESRRWKNSDDNDDYYVESMPQKIHIRISDDTEYELTWNKIAKFIHPYLKSTAVSETVETDTPTDLQDTPTDTAAFDYSAVDEDTANYLRKATARIANSYADIGAVLAEAQERLANNKNGIFQKWCVSLGISRATTYRLIDIHKFRSQMIISSQIGTISGNELEIFDNLPKMLQADISSPSAPTEAVNAVLSGDITTHKDFIVMKKKLEESQAKVKELTGRNNRLTEDINNWSEKFKAEKSKRETLLSENDRLGAEIKELRSRPVETVTIEKDPTETEAYQTLLLENDELISKNDELNFKIQDLEGELEAARDNPDSIYNNPQAMQFEQLRDFFEDYYANANRAVRELYQFIKPDYPQDIKDYVRQRLGVLKQYINNLEELHEGEF